MQIGKDLKGSEIQRLFLLLFEGETILYKKLLLPVVGWLVLHPFKNNQIYFEIGCFKIKVYILILLRLQNKC